MAGLIGFGLMIVLVLLSVNVSFAIIIAGLIGLVLTIGLDPALSSMAIIAFERSTDYKFAVIPLFIQRIGSRSNGRSFHVEVEVGGIFKLLFFLICIGSTGKKSPSQQKEAY